jgi:hypothetical protein
LFTKSVILFIIIISDFFVLISVFGEKIYLNHIFSASFILFSRCIGFLTFQVNDISHMYIESLGKTLFNLLEIIDAAKLKSIPGSSIFNHLAIFV